MTPDRWLLHRIAVLLDTPDVSGADLHQDLVVLLHAAGHYPPTADPPVLEPTGGHELEVTR